MNHKQKLEGILVQRGIRKERLAMILGIHPRTLRKWLGLEIIPPQGKAFTDIIWRAHRNGQWDRVVLGIEQD